MNTRGQAALEYLMTYGWALIVIAIVVGVLVFIVATPTGGVNCTSSSPGKINVISNNLATTATAGSAFGSIALTNLTGGAMNPTFRTSSGYFALDDTAEGSVGVGDFTITPLAAAAGSPTSGTIKFGFTDVVGLDQNVVVTCQGATLVIS